jgi:hypothetical protein
MPAVRRLAAILAADVAGYSRLMGANGAGVFERYPRLKVSFGESGAGWLGYALHRMDFEFEDRFRDLMKLKPSEYWHRHAGHVDVGQDRD